MGTRHRGINQNFIKSILTFGKRRVIALFLLAIFLTSIAVPPASIYAETVQERERPVPAAAETANKHIKQYDQEKMNKQMGTDYAGPIADKVSNAPVAADAEKRADKQGAFSGDSTSLSAPISGDTSKQKLEVKELVDRRTATSKFIRNADGSMTEKQYLVPQHYKKDGKWTNIKSNLIEDKNAANTTHKLGQLWGEVRSKLQGDPTTFKMEENAWQAQFAPSDDAAGMVRVSYAGDSITFRPVDAAAVAPVITTTADGQKVLYKELWPGIDVEYKVENHLLKEYSVLKSKDATNAYRFAIEGASLEADPKLKGGFRPTGDLKDKISIAPLVVLGMDGKPLTTEEVAKQSYKDGELRATVDREWMQSLHSDQYPIVVDPTLYVNVWDGSWSHHYSYSSDGSSCTYVPQACEVMVGSYYGTHIRSSIKAHYWGAANRRVYSAKLHIAQMQGNVGTGVGRWTTAQGATCEGLGNGFDCIDWSKPRPWAWFVDSGIIDVTSIFWAYQEAQDYEPWIMLSGEECGGSCDTLKMFNPSQTFFEIVYGPANPTIIDPNPGSATTFVDPQPSFKVQEPVGAPSHVQHIFRVTTQKNAGVMFTSGKTSNRTWTVPDGILDDGTTYYVQAQAYEQATDTYSYWGTPVEFRIDSRKGKDSTQQFDNLGPVSVGLATGNLSTSATSHTSSALGGSLGVNLEYNSPLRSRNGLVGQYFNNTTYSGTPVATQVEPKIKFEWASGPGASPVPGVVNDDNFSGLWTGYFVAPKTASYQFGCYADDSGRIWVDNNLVSERWTAFNGSNQYCPWSSPIALTAGQIVPFKAAHKEDSGYAVFDALVKTTDNSIPEQAIPTEWLQTGVRPIHTTNGLLGRYYSDNGTHNFSDAANQVFVQRTDSLLSFNWGTEGPVPAGTNKDFMARWTGYLTVPTTGNYELGTHGDDGMRIKINNSTVTDNWVNGANPVTYGSSVALTAGTPVPISVEYYDAGGQAYAGLHIKSTALSIVDQVIPSEWLSTSAPVLPAGWDLGIDPDGGLSYERLKANQNSVVLTDSTGSTHEYTSTGNTYKPPVNEDGQLIRNDDGTFTLLDIDGRTYVFGVDGLLRSVTTPTDDRKPAALQYNYATINNGPARLTEIVDSVDPSRKATVHYSGDAQCGSTPSGFDTTPANMLCAVKTNDGRATYFYYSGGQLARIAEPGSEYTDYQYETLADGSKRISAVRDPLANDAVAASQRTADNTVLTQVEYDLFGRVSKVTQPAATTGATRTQHTIKYFSGDSTYAGATEQHVVGASEPNGFSRRIEYDKTLRTLKDVDVANLASTTEWHAAKDMVLSTTDATGLKSTTIYDDEDRATDQYGPAPTAWFGVDRKPTATYTNQVPHTETTYDQNIVGPEVTYFNYKATNKTLVGAPRLRTTGVDTANPGTFLKGWGNNAQPISVQSGYDGWGLRAVGKLRVPVTGTYNFDLWHDDGAKLIVDDKWIAGVWDNGTYRRDQGNIALEAGKVYRFIVEMYDTNTSGGQIDLYYYRTGQTASNVFGTMLKPGYGLAGTTKAYDATLGDSVATTNFGSNPELGLAQSSSVDPTGLNLTTSSTYETPGATGSFLRQTAKYLPGANTAVATTATQYAHYAATDTKDNPCTTGTTEAYKQGGFMKLKTEPDPDGTGSKVPRFAELIYNDAGSLVASRYGTGSWTCLTYDVRGRVLQTTVPAFNGSAARTITNSYAVSGNPLEISSSDTNGTIVTTLNLLGQTIEYVDVYGNWTGYEYNSLSQPTRKYGDMGEELFYYDNLNRLSQHLFDEVVYATVSYDAFSRIDYISYNNAGSMKLDYTYDDLGRESASTYTLGDGTTTVAETVTRTQSNQITGTSVVSGASTLTTTYTYDAADRLTGATIGANTYGYGFGAQNTTLCGSGTGTNANSGKNSNRTTQTINGVTTNFCYDYADRLTTSSNTLYNTPVYDTHGNMTKIGTGTTPLELSYDSSDRSSGYEQINASNGNGVGVYYDRDVQGRIIGRYKSTITGWSYTSSGDWFYNFTGTGDAPDFVRNAAWDVVEQNLSLPGGVLLTLKPQEPVTNNKKQYSLPNTHGDTLLMTNAAGTNTSNGSGPASSFAYDPFGQAITGSVLPANTNGASYGWVGQHQKFTETALALTPIPMGARVYLPGIGRFTQVDSVEGGTENSFVYPADPISKFDLTGNYFETIYDIGSLIYDINELRKSKSWSNAGWVAWDVAAIALPVVPGAGGARAAAKAGKKAKAITDAKQIADQAKKLGYATRKNAKQLDNVTNGQPGFINGRKMISRDVDNHNCTNCWKVFIKKNGRWVREGTYSWDLKTRIKK